MTSLLPIFTFAAMLLCVFVMLLFAFSGPNADKIQARRVNALRGRHGASAANAIETQMRRVMANRETRLDSYFTQFVPKPDLLRKRLSMTGKNWSLGQFALAVVILGSVIFALAMLKHMPVLLALMLALFVGMGLPHMVIGSLIKRRIKAFNANFPEAIELLVRGLRSGLPISETLHVVSTEVPGPVGEEFRSVTDKIKIGKTMDAALQDTADRLGTPEFQFFCITLAIQRETGGNLAETLSNLATVLRSRMQMKLKINAMSSESKASAYIIGVLPFLVFSIILYLNPGYMGKFFTDERLIMIGGGGLVWMSIGAFVMRQMINFEI